MKRRTWGWDLRQVSHEWGRGTSVLLIYKPCLLGSAGKQSWLEMCSMWRGIWERQMGRIHRAVTALWCCFRKSGLGFVFLSTARRQCGILDVIVLYLWLLCLWKEFEFGPHAYISFCFGWNMERLKNVLFQYSLFSQLNSFSITITLGESSDYEVYSNRDVGMEGNWKKGDRWEGGRDREQSLFLPLYFSKSYSSHGNFQTRLALLCLYLQALVWASNHSWIRDKLLLVSSLKLLKTFLFFCCSVNKSLKGKVQIHFKWL